MQTIIEYIKLFGMTVVYTLGQAICFGVVLPTWALTIHFAKE